MLGQGSVHSVLLVDDEHDLVEVLSEELRAAGFEVTAVGDARRALAAVRLRQFDAVVTDFKMPGMDGLELMILLKEVDPGLPIIVITGFASEGARLALDAREAFGVLLKPFTFEEIRTMLERAVKPRQPPADAQP